MKTKAILFAIIAMGIVRAEAQKTNPLNDMIQTYTIDTSRIGNWYTMSASEIIFSGGEVKSGGRALDNVVRFSMFFHFQQQFHYNFNNTFGMFTGFGLRNIGFINKVPVDATTDATVKQRSYSFGVPLALKIG